MGRARRCAICASDPAITSQVNAQIEAGCKQKLIHEQNPQFSVSQISRHTRNCLTPKPASFELTTETRSSQIARWLTRAEVSYAVAASQGDAKAQVAAISAATRALGQLEKQVKAETEAEKADVDDRYSIGAIDQSLREFMAQRDSERGGIGAKSACLCQEEPKFGELVLIIWSDRRLLETLLIHAKNCAVHIADGFIPPRETQNVTAND